MKKTIKLVVLMLFLFINGMVSYGLETFLLAKEDIPSSFLLLPAPPAENSASFERDKKIYLQTRLLKDTSRWTQASFDADLEGHLSDFFTDITGLQITPEQTPSLYFLLRESSIAFVLGTRSAKRHYRRVRPFVYFEQPGTTCFTQDEPSLEKDGSYPSGHSAVGFGQSLVLSQLMPEKADELLRRGYNFGQSRVICGAHWQSDVDAGRVVAASVFARLQNSKVYLKLLKKAKKEIKKQRKLVQK